MLILVEGAERWNRQTQRIHTAYFHVRTILELAKLIRSDRHQVCFCLRLGQRRERLERDPELFDVIEMFLNLILGVITRVYMFFKTETIYT